MQIVNSVTMIQVAKVSDPFLDQDLHFQFANDTRRVKILQTLLKWLKLII